MPLATQKTDCEEILDMLRFPAVYAAYGSKMPRGYVSRL